MDICLRKIQEGAQIKVCSIHGMLWLQTHFEEKYWKDLANNEVKMTNSDIKELSIDAKEAGLILNYVPVLSLKSCNS